MEGWNGNFRQKKDRHRISGLDPLISKLYGSEDVKFNNGVKFKRGANDFEDLLTNHQYRERRAAGEEDIAVGLVTSHNELDIKDLSPMYKLYLVSN